MAAPPRTRVLVAPGAPSDRPTSFEAHEFQAPHPRTGLPTHYLLTPSARLLEVNAHAPPHAAWLAAAAVATDGRLLLATPVDPLLLALPRLAAARAATGGFVDIHTALGGSEEDEAGRAASSHWLAAALAAVGGGGADGGAAAALASVCDVKRVGDDAYVRLADDRVLAWLKAKAARVGAALRAAGGGAAAGMDDAAAAAAGAALLAEWLPTAWAEALGAPVPGKAGAADAGAAAAAAAAPGSRWCVAGDGPGEYGGEGAVKRARLDPKEAARAKAAAAREEARAGARAKEAAGMARGAFKAFFVPKKK